MTDPDLTRLASLVGDVEEFAAQHWGSRPLHRPADADVTEILDVADIERLLASSARRPTFRLVQDGATLPPERSTAPARLGGARVDDVADLARIATAVEGGATLVMQSLQRTSLPVAELCRSLERATSHPVQANAYLTPPGASGLARHHDEHDVLVVQLSGHKAWKVDGLGALATQTGDVLYLPAGTQHAAEAQHEASLHVTLGLLRVTVEQALHRALARMDDLELRRPLPLGYARPERAEALAAELTRTVDDVARLAGTIDIAAAADAERDRARARRPPLLLGQLGAVLRLHEVGPRTVVACRADQPTRCRSGDGTDERIVLELTDRRVLLPQPMRPALEHLLHASATAVEDLPGLDAGSRLVLARRLIREGVLEVVRWG